MTDQKIKPFIISDEIIEKMKAQAPKETKLAFDDPHILKMLEAAVNGKVSNLSDVLSAPPPPPLSSTKDILVEQKALMTQLAHAISGKKQKPLRIDQITKERCQTAAKLLWKCQPNLTIAAVAKHPDIDNIDITGARRYGQRTVSQWVAEVFPKNQKKQVGRPAKKLK